MSIEIDDNVAEVLADRLLNKQSATDWGIKCLELGFDSKNLRILASMLPIDPPSELDEKRRLAIEELGWNRIPTYVYMMRYARNIAKNILADRRDAFEGSGELHQILCTIDASWELGAWYSLEDRLYDTNPLTPEEAVSYTHLTLPTILRV